MLTNQYNYLTAKERDTLSFPAKLLLNKSLLVGEVLDFGCGFGKDVELLNAKGINIIGYDKYYFPKYPVKKFDTIICFYVLNVLMQEEQSNVLMEISQLLKPTGKAYFAVRRDLHYEGFRTHTIHRKPTYQCNVILNYESFFKNENCELYEYKHFNQINRNENPGCPFCNPSAETALLLESATVYSMFDKYPVSNGHTLIIPKKHCDDYFQLSFKEQSACWFMVNKVKDILQNTFNPDGFNIGVNIHETGGQTIPHVHIHVIPRFNGDVKEPRGGVRGVIPEKKNY
ncbi:MAG: bifunctional class I SAM-dependent methyltransferase/HIT family protein [Bacteroidota bacterium]